MIESTAPPLAVIKSLRDNERLPDADRLRWGFKMARRFTRALLTAAALLGGAICSGAANASTVIDLGISPITGTATGSGSFDVSSTQKGTRKATDLTITIDGTYTFDFSTAIATFNKNDQLISLVGFDANDGASLTLALLGGSSLSPVTVTLTVS